MQSNEAVIAQQKRISRIVYSNEAIRVRFVHRNLAALCCKAYSDGDKSIILQSKQTHLEMLPLHANFPGMMQDMHLTKLS